MVRLAAGANEALGGADATNLTAIRRFPALGGAGMRADARTTRESIASPTRQARPQASRPDGRLDGPPKRHGAGRRAA